MMQKRMSMIKSDISCTGTTAVRFRNRICGGEGEGTELRSFAEEECCFRGLGDVEEGLA